MRISAIDDQEAARSLMVVRTGTDADTGVVKDVLGGFEALILGSGSASSMPRIAPTPYCDSRTSQVRGIKALILSPASAITPTCGASENIARIAAESDDALVVGALESNSAKRCAIELLSTAHQLRTGHLQRGLRDFAAFIALPKTCNSEFELSPLAESAGAEEMRPIPEWRQSPSCQW